MADLGRVRRLRAGLTAAVLVLPLAGCSPGGTSARAVSATAGMPSPVDRSNGDGTSTPVADPIYPSYGNPALDVRQYTLALDWAPDRRTLTGTATIRLRAVVAVPELRLDFSDRYTLTSVTVDGAAATARIADGDLRADRPLAAGAEATLTVAYAGTSAPVPAPTHRTDVEPLGLTVTAAGELWTMQEPYGASTWYPANDQPSDKARYDITVTVPPGWTAVATGTPAPGPGFHYVADRPVAAYLTTLAVGHYTRTDLTGPHGLPIAVWTRTGIDDPVRDRLARAGEYLGWLEERFGPFPFPSAGIVVVPSGSAMETQQTITVGQGVLKDAATAREVLVHEFAHQWFGDAVGPSTWRDVWLNEGWAFYVEALYRTGGDADALANWELSMRRIDGELRKQLGPPGAPPADSFAETNVYICPALLLRQLHKALGDRRFLALGRAWSAAHAGTAQDRAAFTAFVNRQTGRDFTALIDAWLDSPATPA